MTLRALLPLLLSPCCWAADDVQRVEGFERVVFAHNNHPSATVQTARDFRGSARGYMTAGWWAPGQMKDNRLEWETAACAAKKDTVFAFIGASSPLPPAIARGPEVKLYVNGEYALTFSVGLQREWEWRGQTIRMRYRPVRNEWTSWGRQRQFELEGNSGIYELSVPAANITEGRPIRVTAVVQPFTRWPNGWFMVKDRRDTLDRSPGELRQEVDQLRTDVNRLSEMVHVLSTRQYSDLSGQDRFENFTIYTNGYRHLHPADIIPMRSGGMLLTAREATEHVARDGDIVVLRSEDGRKWAPKARFGVPNLDEREACGVELPDGTIILAVFYNALYRDDDEYEQKWKTTVKLGAGKQYLGFYTVTSKDRGATWTEPKFVSTKGMPFSDTEGPADAPIVMPDGSLLLPLIAYNVHGDINNHASVMLKSSDNGSTWSYLSTMANDPGGKLGHFDEPGVLRLRSGTLLAAMRNSTGDIWLSKSKDNGVSWSAPKRSNMTGHPADLIQLSDGRVLCTYGMREPYHGTPGGIRASFSKDEGETWDLADDVHVRNDLLNWDIGYPESLQLPNGNVLTVYYYNLLGRYYIGGSIWKP
jgi:sialidase-1